MEYFITYDCKKNGKINVVYCWRYMYRGRRPESLRAFKYAVLKKYLSRYPGARVMLKTVGELDRIINAIDTANEISGRNCYRYAETASLSGIINTITNK